MGLQHESMPARTGQFVAWHNELNLAHRSQASPRSYTCTILVNTITWESQFLRLGEGKTKGAPGKNTQLNKGYHVRIERQQCSMFSRSQFRVVQQVWIVHELVHSTHICSTIFIPYSSSLWTFSPNKQVTKVSDKDKSHFIGNTESREKMVEKEESSEDRKKISKDGADVM